MRPAFLCYLNLRLHTAMTAVNRKKQTQAGQAVSQKIPPVK